VFERGREEDSPLRFALAKDEEETPPFRFAFGGGNVFGAGEEEAPPFCIAWI
jgi:exonuclease VII small subunit